jgi:hypothetical protein
MLGLGIARRLIPICVPGVLPLVHAMPARPKAYTVDAGSSRIVAETLAVRTRVHTGLNPTRIRPPISGPGGT